VDDFYRYLFEDEGEDKNNTQYTRSSNSQSSSSSSPQFSPVYQTNCNSSYSYPMASIITFVVRIGICRCITHRGMLATLSENICVRSWASYGGSFLSVVKE